MVLKTRMLNRIIFVVSVIVAGFFISGYLLAEDRSGLIKVTRVIVTTDREEYRPGNTIILTIKNNLNEPISYYEKASFNLCEYAGSGWMFKNAEFAVSGRMKKLKTGDSKKVKFRLKKPINTRLRYKFEYQPSSEGISYTAYSNEFILRK